MLFPSCRVIEIDERREARAVAIIASFAPVRGALRCVGCGRMAQPWSCRAANEGGADLLCTGCHTLLAHIRAGVRII